MWSGTDSLLIIQDHLNSRDIKLSLEQLEEIYKDFKFIPVKDGVILTKRSEMHVVVRPQSHKRWFNKKVRKIIKETLSEYGCVTTKVMNNYDVGHLFAKRLGFKETNRDSNVTYYELRSL